MELEAVNDRPALRRLTVTSEPKKRKAGKQVEARTEEEKSKERVKKEKSEARAAKKSLSEAVRRDAERVHLERMSALFQAPKHGWTRKEALCLGEINFLIDGCDESLTNFAPVALYRLYGPDAFPRDFVKVRPATSGL